MTLIELIKKAQAGEKFNTKRKNCIFRYFESSFKNEKKMWEMEEVLADWTIIKESEVIEFELDCMNDTPRTAIDFPKTGPTPQQYEKLYRKKWKVTCVEVVG